LGRRPSISPGKYATVFQAEVYAILVCVLEIHMDVTPEKYISICSDNQAALKTLEAANTTSPMVHTTVPAFPPDILWDCFGSSDILGYMEMKLWMSSRERELFTSLLDRNQPWGVSRQNIIKEIKC